MDRVFSVGRVPAWLGACAGDPQLVRNTPPNSFLRRRHRIAKEDDHLPRQARDEQSTTTRFFPGAFPVAASQVASKRQQTASERMLAADCCGPTESVLEMLSSGSVKR